MSTTRPDSPARRRASRWTTPAFSVVLGLFFFGLAASRNEWGDAWFSLGLFFGYAALLALLGSRFELVGLLRGDTTDERAGQIHLKAAAFSFHVMVFVLVTGFIVNLIQESETTHLWAGLGAVAGVSLIASYLWLARRS